MPFSFPSSPSIGDKSTQNSREYEWSGYAWEIVATPAALSASVITSGTLDAARLPLATTIAAGAVIVGTGLGVSSGTVSVSYGTTSGTACQGNDSRLSDARTPTSHSHGNITNAGAIGSTANLPVITTTSGVLTTGSFGTTAATFCEGNDSRLSDTRTPTDGSVTTAKIANDAVTYAKLQNVSATDRLLGRSSAGSGDVEEITCTAFGRSLIDDADAAAARTTLSVQPTASPAFTGAATFTVSSGSSVPVTVVNSGTGNSLVVATNFIVDGSGRLGLFGAPRSFEACSVLGTAPSSSQFSLGFRVQCTYPSSTTTDAASFSSFPTTQAASYTLTNLYHFGAFQQAFGAGSTVTNQYGLFVDSTLTGATNNYAVYTGIASGTGRWAIYAAGTAASYFGGQVQISTGSASACGVAFSGDPDTGIAQLSAAGANTLSICTNSAERVRVDASGNVGIGATPSFRLDVLGSANCVAKIKTSAAGSFGCLQIHNANTNGETSIGFRDDSDSDASSWVIGKSVGGVADAFAFYYNGNRAIIESDGVVKLPDVYEDTVGATNRDLFIDNAGKLGYVSSIRASKTNIAAIDDVSWLRDLTPVSFHYRRRNEDGAYSDEADGTLDYGLIAEEVEPVAPEMCFYDVVDGEPQLRGVHYSKLITPMLRYIQQLEQRIAALEERNNA